MIPVVSIVGTQATGKTTLICKLITEFTQREVKIATIKHDRHGFDIDQEGKDTWKHSLAGASTVAISSPEKFAMYEQVNEEKSIDEVVSKIDNVDLVLTEGYKYGDKPKIELISPDYPYPVSNPRDLIAIVVGQFDKINIEGVIKEQFDNLPVFTWNETESITDLLEEEFLLK